MDMVGQHGGPGGGELGAAVSFIAGWMAMMLVMMLPSLLPMLSTYRRSVRAGQAGAGGARERRLGIQTTLVGAGYFGVWLVVGAVVYLVGVALAAAGIRWSTFASSVPIATGVVLLLAGCIQLSAWKARHLGRCFAAPACGPFMEPTTRRAVRSAARHGARSAARHGVELGVHCSLACASYMMILLVTGAMSLGAMAVVTLAITAERLAPSPARAARVAGVVVLAAGALVIVRALV